MNLDKKDQRILHELILNSRQHSTKIAKKVELSREVVEYRIKRLIEKGIIRKFETKINVELFGYRPYNIFLLFQDYSEEKENEITDYLANHPSVRWMVSCFGQWDIVFRLSAKDRKQFDKIISNILQHFGSNLRSYEIITSIKKIKSLNPVELFYGGKKANKLVKKNTTKFKINKDDIKLLTILNKNSRTSLLEISKVMNITPEAVKYKIKKLENQGVIDGYSCIIDLSKLNYSWYVLLFSIRQLSMQEQNKLKTLFLLNKKIIFVDKCLGDWNYHVEILAENTIDFQKTVIDLRNKLGLMLNTFELLMVSKEYVNNRFPKFFENELIN